jgi:hypothetical protein
MTETLASLVADRTLLRWTLSNGHSAYPADVLLRKSITGSKSSYCQQVLLMVFFRRRKIIKAASESSVLAEGSLSRQLAYSHHRTGGLGQQF